MTPSFKFENDGEELEVFVQVNRSKKKFGLCIVSTGALTNDDLIYAFDLFLSDVMTTDKDVIGDLDFEPGDH